MPYVYVYQCDGCQFDVEITVCREFRKEPDGTRADYEYPNPDLYEWPPRRVSGIWSHLWCKTCRASRPLVLVELDGPAEHPVQAFLAAEARGLNGTETGPCPVCGEPLAVEIEDAPCPQCETGSLHNIGEYEP
jgi:hypothetical protein